MSIQVWEKDSGRVNFDTETGLFSADMPGV